MCRAIHAYKFVGWTLLCGLLAVFFSLGDSHAACFGADQQLPPLAISTFTADPQGLLKDPKNAEGGESLISAIRDLAASDPSTLAKIVGLLKTTNSAGSVL